MQYAVPQFTDVEDKLIGPLTLKQFLSILATGGVILFFWSLLGISVFFFLFAAPVALLGLALTFGKFNGKPLYGYVGPIISFFSKPQVRIFIREEPTTIIKMAKPTQGPAVQKQEEPTESRLKKLAYLLDQQSKEEQALIKKS